MNLRIRAWDKNKSQMLASAIISSMPVSMVNADTSKVFMRYTELKDKQKKHIYEGDIVLYQDVSRVVMGVVRFGQLDFHQCYYIEWDCTQPPRPELFYYTKNKLITVVGNVFENKSLLTPQMQEKGLGDNG